MASAIFENVICVQCGEREAYVFIRRSADGGSGCDLALCETCARGRGISAGKGGLELNIDDLIGDGPGSSPTAAANAVCPGCGLEIGALRREGRLGCSLCADTFFDEITKVVGRRAPVGAVDSAAASSLEPRAVRLELEAALAAEDYEKAAKLRDELSRLGASAGSSAAEAAYGAAASAATDFPLDPFAFPDARGPQDDVVLSSSAVVSRDIVGLPFPGSPNGPSAPSRSILLRGILSYGSWRARTMAELGAASRRSLSERGFVSRAYAADDEAVLLSGGQEGVFALLDEGDHFRARGVRPGLDAKSALGAALGFSELVGRNFELARKPGIGWICARVSDCGLAASVSITVHIPAIAATGMRDRLFRSLLSDGVAISGFYSSGEESAGSIYELRIDPPRATAEAGLAVEIMAVAQKVVAAERLARDEISEKGRDAIADAEGRAFGVARHCRLLGAEEAASILSVLRLAALRKSLVGADPHAMARAMGSLLRALGPGSIALVTGLREMPSASSLDMRRARLVKDALALAEYRVEEGA